MFHFQPVRSLRFPLGTSLIPIFRPIASTSMLNSKEATVSAAGESKEMLPKKSEVPEYIIWNGNRYKVNYKGLIEEEVDAAKLEYWIKHGYVHPINHRPYYWAMRYLTGKRPNMEHIKAWQFHFQKDDGKFVWQKGPFDALTNWIVSIIVVVSVLAAVSNLYFLVTPADKNPWIWKGDKKKEHH